MNDTQNKAPKLSHQVLHTGNNKENVSLTLSIFDEKIVTASSCNVPDWFDMSWFLDIFHK